MCVRHYRGATRSEGAIGCYTQSYVKSSSSLNRLHGGDSAIKNPVGKKVLNKKPLEIYLAQIECLERKLFLTPKELF